MPIIDNDANCFVVRTVVNTFVSCVGFNLAPNNATFQVESFRNGQTPSESDITTRFCERTENFCPHRTKGQPSLESTEEANEVVRNSWYRS